MRTLQLLLSVLVIFLVSFNSANAAIIATELIKSSNSVQFAVDESGNKYKASYYLLQKNSDNGSLLWQHTVSKSGGNPNSGYPLPEVAKAGANGELFVIYSSRQGTIHFPGLDVVINANNTKFLVKFDTDGNAQWSKIVPGEYVGIDIGRDGKLYLFGAVYKSESEGSVTVFGVTNPRPAEYGSYYFSYIAKMSSAGTVSWVKASSGQAKVSDIEVDTSGNIYVAGTFRQSPDFFGEQLTKTSNGSDPEIFIAKLNSSARAVWANASGAQSCSSRTDSTNVSLSNDSVFVLGTVCKGTTLFGTHSGILGGSDAFLASFNKAGQLHTAERIGTKYDDAGLALGLRPNGNGGYISLLSGLSKNGNLLALGRREVISCQSCSQERAKRLFFLAFDGSSQLMSAHNISGTENAYRTGNNFMNVTQDGDIHLAGIYKGDINIFGMRTRGSRYQQNYFLASLKDLNIEDVNLSIAIGGIKTKIATVAPEFFTDSPLRIMTPSGIRSIITITKSSIKSFFATKVKVNIGTNEESLLDYSQIMQSHNLGRHAPPTWSKCRLIYRYENGTQQARCDCYPMADVPMRYCAERPLNCTAGQSPSWNSDTEEYECAYRYAWEYSAWDYSSCSAAGDISGTRSVVCKNSGGDVAADSHCQKVRRKPDTTRVLTCGMWLASEWGTCQDHVKTRELSCVHKDTNIPLPDEKCPSTNRIGDTRTCHASCVLGTARHDSGWSQCYRVGQHYGGRAFKMACNDGTYYITEYESIRCSGGIQSGPRVFGR